MFAGFLSDAIGRKMSLLLDTGVFFLGFLLLATGHLPSCLIVARLLLGYPLVSQVAGLSNYRYLLSNLSSGFLV